jgi:CDP-paratose 2-epimerase
MGHIEMLIGRAPDVRFADWRAGDQRYFVADTRRIGRELGLLPARGWREGVAALADWLAAERGLPLGQELSRLKVPA